MPDFQHFKLFKPYGYLTPFENNQTTRKNKKRLRELHDFPEGTIDSVSFTGYVDGKERFILNKKKEIVL